MNEQRLPLEFIKTIEQTFDDAGRAWLEKLPELIADASKQWGLNDIRFVSNLSYNFVAFAHRSSTIEREDVILKIGVPHRELNSEVAALKYFNGNGAARLLEHDAERSMFLLERLKPGEMLSMLDDDDECTNIAADVMLNLWRDVPKESESLRFIRLSDWFGELKNLRPTFNGGTGAFPSKIVERVESLLPELFKDENVKLIHGDLHHYNILSSGRGWLAIDPKGVVGPRGYEAGPLLINPMPLFLNRPNPQVQTERRIRILSERLGISRDVIRDWALCHAILSAWWDWSPNGGNEYSLRCAEVIASARIK